jgi:hypothetical protein
MKPMKRFTMYAAGSALLCFGLTVIMRGQRNDRTPGKWVSEASMHSPRSGACSVLLRDGRVLIAGGADGSRVLRNVEIFDADGSFSIAASMSTGRSGHACAALADGTVLVAGGDAVGGTALSSAEVYNPAADSWSAAHSMTTPRAGATASLLRDGRWRDIGSSIIHPRNVRSRKRRIHVDFELTLIAQKGTRRRGPGGWTCHNRRRHGRFRRARLSRYLRSGDRRHDCRRQAFNAARRAFHHPAAGRQDADRGRL